MNRFDRVTALLLHLQTHQLVRAQDLASRFEVTERTIYRDIRTLENAGVPIVSEPGVGYYLDKSFRLPPVSFNRDEVAALVIGGKIIQNQVDGATLDDFQQAMNKIRSVLDGSDRHYLDIIDEDIVVQHPSDGNLLSRDNLWLRDCRTALSRLQPLQIEYEAAEGQSVSKRDVEPVGLYFYSQHWHLIAWCRLRHGYRDFRLDRVKQLQLLGAQFRRRDFRNLQEYLSKQSHFNYAHEIRVRFSHKAAQNVDAQRHYFGFVEELITKEGTEMRFLVPHLKYFAGWLLQYNDEVELIAGGVLRPVIHSLLGELSHHWQDE